LKTNRIKKSLFVFVLCLSVVFPGLISEGIATNNINSQDIDTQLGTFSIDDPIGGGGTYTINAPTQSSPANGIITYDRKKLQYQTITILWSIIMLIFQAQ